MSVGGRRQAGLSWSHPRHPPRLDSPTNFESGPRGYSVKYEVSIFLESSPQSETKRILLVGKELAWPASTLAGSMRQSDRTVSTCPEQLSKSNKTNRPIQVYCTNVVREGQNVYCSTVASRFRCRCARCQLPLTSAAVPVPMPVFKLYSAISESHGSLHSASATFLVSCIDPRCSLLVGPRIPALQPLVRLLGKMVNTREGKYNPELAGLQTTPNPFAVDLTCGNRLPLITLVNFTVTLAELPSSPPALHTSYEFISHCPSSPPCINLKTPQEFHFLLISYKYNLSEISHQGALRRS